ncbi:MAG: hypothetical protein PHG97_00570, partial [Candidatus Margulisbacteria bacterium]|nr:hypothetical protein [Candidatus Margulisiibacteriota bacterium]
MSLPYIAAPGSGTTSQVSIKIAYGNDGAIAYRPVTLSPDWGAAKAPKDVEYKWTVTGPDGVHELADQTFPFTPQAKGDYTAVLTVSSNDPAASPIVTQANLSIGSFDPPFIEILDLPSGGYVAEGTILPIPISIQKNNWPGARNVGDEDKYPNATCHVTITGTTVGETPIFDQDGRNCNDISVKLPTLPPGTTEKSYLINASINSPQYEQPGIAAAKPLYIQALSQCNYNPNPSIQGIIDTNADISNIYVGDIKRFSMPFASILLCDGKPLSAANSQVTAYFKVNNGNYVPAQSDSNGYYVDITFNKSGPYSVFFKIELTDKSDPHWAAQYKSRDDLYAKDLLSSGGPKPSAVIGGLEYSYTVGQSANVTCNSDASNVKYKFLVTRPDKPQAEEFNQQNISYLFDIAQDYAFKCLVLDSTGTTTLNYDLKGPITVVPAQIPACALSIIASQAIFEKTDFIIKVGNPTPNCQYSWDMGDNQPFPLGEQTTYQYANSGAYQVYLHASINVGGKDYPFVSPSAYPIFAIEKSLPLPKLFISMPDSAQVNTQVSVDTSNLDDANYNYTIYWGDNKPVDTIIPGVVAQHIFDTVGPRKPVLTATLKSNPAKFYEISYDIYIKNYPVPNVGIQGPNSAPVNMDVSFILPNPTPGATCSWNFGDTPAVVTPIDNSL